MTVQFKITRRLLQTIKRDLARPHAFAHERVGWVSAGLSSADDELWILARGYRTVADADYLRDSSVGAMMGPDAIRKALQWAMSEGVAIFHVHTHGGLGRPGFSGIDLREQAKFVPNFFQLAPQSPHGALVLSDNSAHGHIWLDANNRYEAITSFVEVGAPLKDLECRMSRFDRQSFLGADSETTLFATTLGFVGLGGGGSHLIQQTGHLGIGGFVNVDPDHITDTNTNRLIGGTLADLATATSKVAIAGRLLRGLQKRPRIIAIRDTWHNATAELKRCAIIVGALDSFKERDELERFARRHLIPYIDIGMDVHDLGNKNYLIGGQVFLSMPGKPCLRCCGLITDERLALEAKKYGAAGSRPQVVWSNGVLASTAVGLITQLLTPWFSDTPEFVYLDYDGNRGTLNPNDRMQLLRDKVCSHHPPEETGDPLFDVREFNRLRAELALRQPRSLFTPTRWWQTLRAMVARLFRP